ncbi:hypothetical protein OIO90_003061 [Microbotryomycetes sp. JL221]|nr:hypothetical protein OIO90_003061 [Microbotryomycetes sp. JL221]
MSGDQDLLFKLRSPTIPLDDKLELVQSALEQVRQQQNDASNVRLHTVVRDWLVQTFIKLRTNTKISIVDSQAWWSVLAQTSTTGAAVATVPTSLLSVFATAIEQCVSRITPSEQTIELIVAIDYAWRAFGPMLARKALIDNSLEAVATMFKAAALVWTGARQGVINDAVISSWRTLALDWMHTFRPVLDAAKGAKKLTSFTLTNLATIARLLHSLTGTEDLALRHSVLDLVQLTLFNAEALKRGHARESYNATTTASSSGQDSIDRESVAGALVAALKEAIDDEPEAFENVVAVVGPCTRIYFDALAGFSDVLFPLPARSTFANPSAARSAAEIHALQKRRALAAAHTANVLVLLAWTDKSSACTSAACSALADVLNLVNIGDLHREGQTPEWASVLKDVVTGATNGLLEPTLARDGLFTVLRNVLRLTFTALDPAMPIIFSHLATQPPSPHSESIQQFMIEIVQHHSRSLSLPELLSQIVKALAATTSRRNNLLTSRAFVADLEKAISGMVGSATVLSTWTSLLGPLLKNEEATAEASTEADFAMNDEGDHNDDDDEEGRAKDSRPTKKRRREPPSNGTKATQTVTDSPLESCARLRVLGWFLRSLSIKQLDGLKQEVELLGVTHWSTTVKQLAKAVRKNKDSVAPFVELMRLGYDVRDKLRYSGEGMGSWSLRGKRIGEMTELVSNGGDSSNAEVTVTVCRLLLQAVDVGECEAEEITNVIETLIKLASRPSSATWDGHVRDMNVDVVPVAAWDLITGRFFNLIDAYATSEQLEKYATVLAASLIGNSTHDGLNLCALTQNLLRRADIYEMKSMQPHVHRQFTVSVTVPGLESLANLLKSQSPPVIAIGDVATVVDMLRSIGKFVPLEYLGKRARNDLIERALCLDLALTKSPEDQLLSSSDAQFVLRQIVRRMMQGQTTNLTNAPQVLAQLVKKTSASDERLLTVTLDLYRTIVCHALQSARDSKQAAQLGELVSHFDKPFSNAAKQAKKGSWNLSCEERAFVVLCDAVVGGIEHSQLPEEVVNAFRSSAKTARKQLCKALAIANGALWSIRIWLQADDDAETHHLLASFAQTSLSALTSLPDGTAAEQSLPALMAILDLLAFRISSVRQASRHQAQADTSKALTELFETFIASQYAFRKAVGARNGSIFDSSLREVVSKATVADYKLALDDVENVIGFCAAQGHLTAAETVKQLGPPLSLASALVRDGPEGSTRTASASFSELLKHLSVVVARFSPGSSECTGVDVARVFELVARLVEGVCADRPLVLSRDHVGTIFSLVTRMLEPAGPSQMQDSKPLDVSTSGTLASDIFSSLTSTVTHIVRHRKDHATPLFPLLVTSISSLIAILRRPGFGTTGNGSNLNATPSPAATSTGLGRRAERETKSTLPSWAWEGGPDAIGRDQAVLVGRLIGSLATKTTSFVKSSSTSAADEGKVGKSSNTVSLVGPLSKHAPFIILSYLHACVHPVCPIPSSLRKELQNGWYEVMDAMGTWERQALMRGFLGEDDESERNVLRELYRGWEKERYKGH